MCELVYYKVAELGLIVAVSDLLWIGGLMGFARHQETFQEKGI